MATIEERSTKMNGHSTGRSAGIVAPGFSLSTLVQVNTDMDFATIVVRGSLTRPNCDELIRLVVRTSYLASDLKISVDLSEARSVDPEALKRLADYPAWSVIVPSSPPVTDGQPDVRASHLPAESNCHDPNSVTPSRLAPEEQFPEDLTDLDLFQVEVLNSRTGRQLDMEYIRDTQPDPETSTRLEELTDELDRRDRIYSQR